MNGARLSDLRGVHFILTYRCNLQCDHCFVWGHPQAEGVFTLFGPPPLSFSSNRTSSPTLRAGKSIELRALDQEEERGWRFWGATALILLLIALIVGYGVVQEMGYWTEGMSPKLVSETYVFAAVTFLLVIIFAAFLFWRGRHPREPYFKWRW
jgi:hypothetical protein